EGSLTSITAASLPPGLKSFYLYLHPLISISEDAFDASATTLKSVTIDTAQLKSIPTALKKLTNLTDIYLEHVPIQEWDAATLKQIATTLESLELRNMGLSAWPSWISDFRLLRKIDLLSNDLKYIPDDAFNSVKNILIYLDLSSTGLTQVPNALSTLLNLNTLDLSNNNFTDVLQVEKLSGAPFAPKLSYLYLDSCGLTGVANFSNFSNLTILRLTSNRLSDIPAHSLPTSLTALHLSDNSLLNVPEDIASMPSLFTLVLSDNFITNVESNSFPSSLEYLDLGFNNLTIITNTTFRNLNLLSSLYMDRNPISTIAPEAFSDLVSLRTLSLVDSQLTEIPLAFTLLSSSTWVFLSMSQPVACPFPIPHQLIQWFCSLSYYSYIEATCINGQAVYTYLIDYCQQTATTP
ncbi:unnamed protein product, partial [Candidula unifasciata]